MADINESQELKKTEPNRPVKKRASKKLVIIFVVVFAVAAGATGIGFAAKTQIDKFRDHGPLGFIMNKIVKDLDLTEQQKQEVEKIRDEIRAKMESKKTERESHMQQMEDLFRGSSFDKQKALELVQKHESSREEMRNFFIDEMAKFHAILTPDQRNKAADKMKEIRENKDKFFKDGKWKDDGREHR